jgi:UDP-N-acetylmuramyl pentapeptide phosphotransferase/UDP-N-acetylglucosamine-1-phosphate transferase
MGDTGALFLGLIVSILAIEFIETNSELAGNPYTFKAAPAVTIGILILPLFDTLRVFTMRAIRKTSPFKPDRTHIHHLLIDSGFSHMQATLLLVMVNMVFIFTVFTFQHIGTTLLLLLIFSLATMLTALLFKAASRNRGLRLSSKQNKQLV